MIDIKDNLIHIKTKSNSYVFQVNKYLDLESLYYGVKICNKDLDALKSKRTFIVNTLYPDGDPDYCIDGINFEYSFPYRGDSRSSAFIIGDRKSSMTDFVVEKVAKGANPPTCDMPIPKGFSDSLCVYMKDNLRDKLKLQLWYLVYEDCDVIARFALVENYGEEVTIYKAMSAQYDIPKGNREIAILEGSWGRERNIHTTPLSSGKFCGGSYSGMSSAECSPFFMVKDVNADERKGDVFAFNLMYSASHEISAEVTPYGGLRVAHGIQSQGFIYRLEKGKSFATPVAVSSFSDEGIGKASANMQRFASQYVIPKMPIPIMLNSWESVYFGLNENKLKEFADKAKELGFDGVVIDDGWFVGRSDDTGALGDWIEDKDKFPNGIKAYSEYLKSKGMTMGIWIEPEMISEKSMLYKAHPKWALIKEGARSIVGRNQRILDVTQVEVAEYIYDCLVRLVDEYGAGYIKWDFNRRFSDIAGDEGSGYYYRYISSLYGILRKFTQKYPQIVIENCASGGGRFDLGMLSFCPMSWASDNTDPLSRADIQEGASYGFPIRATLNHISASPSHQARRISSLSARKHTAFVGEFGAQYDITKISAQECEEIKTAVKEYRELRNVVETGVLYRIHYKGFHIWQVARDDGEGFIYMMCDRFYTDSALPQIKLQGMDNDTVYSIRGDNVDVKAMGKTLMTSGLKLPMNDQGIGWGYLNLHDISTLILNIKKEK